MARLLGNRGTGRGGSPVLKPAWAAIAVGLVVSGALVGCTRRDAGAGSIDRDVIPNHYLVIIHLKEDKAGFTDRKMLQDAIRLRNQLIFRVGDRNVSDKYSSALIGFSAVMLPETVRNLQGRPGVEVVRSKRMRLAATQARPPFGLDRLGQRLLPLDRYYGSNLTGQGVHVYVVDTGIMGSNVQFADSLGGSRVAAGFDAINAGKDGREDCEGHGTHVAGTIGATKYGIAKNVTLHPVRVVGCNHLTDTDHVLAGLDWIIANATAPAIVNMSLSGPRYPALDAAVARGIKKGLIFVVAAGNVDDGHSNPDACRASPARVGAAITVGAMDPGKDRIAPFSFRGGCVDLFAPGVNILSARNDSHNYGALMDGTSMAAAHAAGVAALYLEACNRLNIKPPAKDVWKALNAVAGVPGLGNWKGFIKHPWGSPNKLLYWGAAAQPASQPLSSSPMCMRSPLSL